MSNSSVFAKAKSYLQTASQWYLKTDERALEQAYKSALKIKALEDEHFAGKTISANSSPHGEVVSTYLQTELNTYLKNIKTRLREFYASNSFLKQIKQLRIDKNSSEGESTQYGSELQNDAIKLEKLRFIDSTLARYQHPSQSTALVVSNPTERRLSDLEIQPSRTSLDSSLQASNLQENNSQVESVFSKTSFLPRSIFRTAEKVKREIDPRGPKTEEEVIQSFRKSKYRTKASVKFLLLLIFVPLLTQIISKAVLIGPVIEHFRSKEEPAIFINYELEQKALLELQQFEQRIAFENLIGRTPSLTPEEREARIQEKAIDLAAEFSRNSFDAIKNIFSDLLASVAFIILLVTGQRDLAILKAFIDETIYGLSDSAKAFLIILFTDVFVGFHSTHGWEVLLEGTLRHFGLPENRDFIYAFIATFPVMLDAMFKYWIFRYLNQISPSAVATYKNMNE